MKIKDLTEEWHVGSNYAILSLPFVTYSVQPHWRNRYESLHANHRYTISYKSNIVVNYTFEEEYISIETGRKSCEQHLQKLLNYLFLKLERIVDYSPNVVYV